MPTFAVSATTSRLVLLAWIAAALAAASLGLQQRDVWVRRQRRRSRPNNR